MDISSRIKEVRKQSGLSQAAFGQRLGVSRDVINNIENNRVDLSEIMFKALCAEFSISESWLRTGNGGMFVEDDNALLTQLAKQYGLDDFSRKFIETYINLPEAHRAVIKNFARVLAVEASGEIDMDPAPEVSIGGSLVADPEIASELSSYAQELEIEKREAANSSALGGAKEA